VSATVRASPSASERTGSSLGGGRVDGALFTCSVSCRMGREPLPSTEARHHRRPNRAFDPPGIGFIEPPNRLAASRLRAERTSQSRVSATRTRSRFAGQLRHTLAWKKEARRAPDLRRDDAAPGQRDCAFGSVRIGLVEWLAPARLRLRAAGRSGDRSRGLRCPCARARDRNNS
jgi:hypothetical protein